MSIQIILFHLDNLSVYRSSARIGYSGLGGKQKTHPDDKQSLPEKINRTKSLIGKAVSIHRMRPPVVLFVTKSFQSNKNFNIFTDNSHVIKFPGTDFVCQTIDAHLTVKADDFLVFYCRVILYSCKGKRQG